MCDFLAGLPRGAPPKQWWLAIGLLLIPYLIQVVVCLHGTLGKGLADSIFTSGSIYLSALGLVATVLVSAPENEASGNVALRYVLYASAVFALVGYVLAIQPPQNRGFTIALSLIVATPSLVVSWFVAVLSEEEGK